MSRACHTCLIKLGQSKSVRWRCERAHSSHLQHFDFADSALLDSVPSQSNICFILIMNNKELHI